ncbi:MAG: hypothetical protein Q8920_16695 [Bacillota bacterium]|nr:hypothetical protein [Bacillota bacterium]
MFYYTNRNSRNSKNIKKNKPEISENSVLIEPQSSLAKAECEISRELSLGEKFALHISHYISQTVTVYVCGGGPSGSGFTGVLADVGSFYIKLISRIGPPPACSLWNNCQNRFNNLYGNILGTVSGLGSVTYIPLNKITCFAHNAIRYYS